MATIFPFSASLLGFADGGWRIVAASGDGSLYRPSFEESYPGLGDRFPTIMAALDYIEAIYGAEAREKAQRANAEAFRRTIRRPELRLLREPAHLDQLSAMAQQIADETIASRGDTGDRSFAQGAGQ